MKQMICALLAVLAVLALGGCGNIADGPAGRPEGEKDCYLEVTAPDRESLGVIPQGEVLDGIFSDGSGQHSWVLDGERPQGLEPEYLCLLWQQETLLAGQGPDADRDYEVVLRVTTFPGTNYVEVEVPAEAVGLWGLPEELTEQVLNFSFLAPEESVAALREAVAGE